jgi:hypothetical protein
MPEVENTTAASIKSVPAVLWNHHKFHVVTMLTPRVSFNASWFIDGNLVPLVEKLFPAG